MSECNIKDAIGSIILHHSYIILITTYVLSSPKRKGSIDAFDRFSYRFYKSFPTVWCRDEALCKIQTQIALFLNRNKSECVQLGL